MLRQWFRGFLGSLRVKVRLILAGQGVLNNDKYAFHCQKPETATHPAIVYVRSWNILQLLGVYLTQANSTDRCVLHLSNTYLGRAGTCSNHSIALDHQVFAKPHGFWWFDYAWVRCGQAMRWNSENLNLGSWPWAREEKEVVRRGFQTDLCNSAPFVVL
jgi:hypothetical protein